MTLPGQFDRAGDSVKARLATAPVPRYGVTFLPHLQKALRGLRAGETSTIGAFPKQGKTSLADQIALDLSIEYPFLYLPLETGVDDTNLRMLAKLSRVSIEDVERFGADDAATKELNIRKLYVRGPKPGEEWDFDTIAAVVRASKAPIVLIDHLRHIAGWLDDGREPTRLLRKIRQLAASSGAHIIQAAQLKFEDYGKKPLAWRYQDSSAVAQLSSFEILIHRPYFATPKDRIAELIVRFNRNGPSGVIHTHWTGDVQMFDHMPTDHFNGEFVECTCKGRKRKSKMTPTLAKGVMDPPAPNAPLAGNA